MIDCPTIADLEAAAQTAVDPQLRTLLTDRLADTISCELQDLTHVLVVERGDCEADIIAAVGFSPLQTRIDGMRNQPDWDWLERHGRYYELLYCVGDSGFAYILFVEDDNHSPLARLCREGGGR